MAATRTTRPRTIQSVDRVVRIIDLLAAAPAGRSLSSLAEDTSLKPQTVQSLLRTLEHHRLVRQSGRGTPYVLGPRLHEWTRRWLGQADWSLAAGAIVADFGKRLDEYVTLVQMRGQTIVHLVEQVPDRPLVVTPTAECPEYLHTMATARVLLAWLDEDERDRLVAKLPMTKRGPGSITDRRAFRRELIKVRRRGYAECIEEAGEGVVALAVPVPTAAGEAVLSLGVALPKVRHRDRPSLLGELRRTAGRISEACGARSNASA